MNVDMQWATVSSTSPLRLVADLDSSNEPLPATRIGSTTPTLATNMRVLYFEMNGALYFLTTS